MLASSVAQVVKNLPYPDSTSGSRRSPEEDNGCPRQHPCLGNPVDRESEGQQSAGSQGAGHD